MNRHLQAEQRRRGRRWSSCKNWKRSKWTPLVRNTPLVLGAAPIIIVYYVQGLRSRKLGVLQESSAPPTPTHTPPPGPRPCTQRVEKSCWQTPRRGRGEGPGEGGCLEFKADGAALLTWGSLTVYCETMSCRDPPCTAGLPTTASLCSGETQSARSPEQETTRGLDAQRRQSSSSVFKRKPKQAENTKMFFSNIHFRSQNERTDNTLFCCVWQAFYPIWMCLFLTGEPDVKCTGNLGICFFSSLKGWVIISEFSIRLNLGFTSKNEKTNGAQARSWKYLTSSDIVARQKWKNYAHN